MFRSRITAGPNLRGAGCRSWMARTTSSSSVSNSDFGSSVFSLLDPEPESEVRGLLGVLLACLLGGKSGDKPESFATVLLGFCLALLDLPASRPRNEPGKYLHL